MGSKTREKAIKALKDIKSVCNSYKICGDGCPFYKGKNICEIVNLVRSDVVPEDWDVDESVKLDKEGEKWSRSF